MLIRKINIMDNRHLTLTIPGPSDVHPESMALEFPRDVLSSPPGLTFQPDTQTAGKDPISRWWNVNDGPWHPLNSTSGAQGGSGQAILSNMHGGQYMVPSHSSMINPQSDSGYESYANHQSAAHGSVCDDTQSTMGRSIVDAQFSLPDTISRSSLALGDPWTHHLRPEANSFVCELCGRAMRTKSELKKHDQRHKKPFKCEIEGCSRGEGFSTVNDLDRHKRSVHPTSQTPGNRYVCSIGACKSKEKTWPRADNFKAHLKRVHKQTNVSDKDLEGHVYKAPNAPAVPQDYAPQGTLPNYNNGMPGLAKEQARNWQLPSFGAHHAIFSSELLNESTWPQTHHIDAAPQQQPYQETTVPNPTSHATIDSPAPILGDSPAPEPEVSVSIPSSPVPEVQEAVTQATTEHATETAVMSADVSKNGVSNESSVPSSRNSPVDIPPDHPGSTDGGASNPIELEDGSVCDEGFANLSLGNLDTKNASEMKKLIEVLQSSGVLEQFGFKKDDSEAVGAAGKQNHPYRCETCEKTFPRKCELKKHAKRHEKPFVCSIASCNKKFGSKNDWKRHEKTQHAGAKTCNCDAKTADSPEGCDRVCSRRGTLGGHGEKGHQVAGQSKSEKGISQGDKSGSSHSTHLPNGDSDHGDDLVLATNAETQHPSREGMARPTEHSISKRKRDDGKSVGKSKKSKSAGSSEDPLPALICCQCGDLITLTGSQVSCHFPCEHRPCSGCPLA